MSRLGTAIAATALVIGLTQVVAGQASPSQRGGAPEKKEVQAKPIIVADTSDDRLPADSFVAVDSVPEMIFQSAPVYPKADLKAGTSGKVWIKAMVNRQGLVRKAFVLKLEQGATDAMGNAAVDAALQNKFRPARSKGRSVACWVTYAVSFVLNESKPTDSSSAKSDKK